MDETELFQHGRRYASQLRWYRTALLLVALVAGFRSGHPWLAGAVILWANVSVTYICTIIGVVSAAMSIEAGLHFVADPRSVRGMWSTVLGDAVTALIALFIAAI